MQANRPFLEVKIVFVAYLGHQKMKIRSNIGAYFSTTSGTSRSSISGWSRQYHVIANIVLESVRARTPHWRQFDTCHYELTSEQRYEEQAAWTFSPIIWYLSTVAVTSRSAQHSSNCKLTPVSCVNFYHIRIVLTQGYNMNRLHRSRRHKFRNSFWSVEHRLPP